MIKVSYTASSFHECARQELAFRTKDTVMLWIWRWMTVQEFAHQLQHTTDRLHIRSLYTGGTVPLSHLAPVQPVKQWHRKSPFLSSQRTVPLSLQGEGEHWSGISNKDRQMQGIQCYRCFQNGVGTNRMDSVHATVQWYQIEEGHPLCSAYQEFNINSLMLAKLSCQWCPHSVLPNVPDLQLPSNKNKWIFEYLFNHLFISVCPIFSC